MSGPVHVTSFYAFKNLSTPEALRVYEDLQAIAKVAPDLRGLCVLGTEGINATFCGDLSGLENVKHYVRGTFNATSLMFKDSLASKPPFAEFRIKIKKEIVTLGRPGLAPAHRQNHLSPVEWQAALGESDTIVLDARNDYEVQIGKFKNAQTLNLNEFREFPDALAKSGLDKQKKILLYCTGGIRCEKAALEMNLQGFESVYQLDGGILNYLEAFPHAEFDGECFVFDYRVAVDQELTPTQKYTLCPHCGQPAHLPAVCPKCAVTNIICSRCHQQGDVACSKNCAHHIKINSRSRRTHRQELGKRHRL